MQSKIFGKFACEEAAVLVEGEFRAAILDAVENFAVDASLIAGIACKLTV